ncbi:hypothetical protein EV424DRAFT_1344584 [Suillus variegatus]|nr:hypothetical protein EV424DRAFT_1344584 [Suillus variegatus]
MHPVWNTMFAYVLGRTALQHARNESMKRDLIIGDMDMGKPNRWPIALVIPDSDVHPRKPVLYLQVFQDSALWLEPRGTGLSMQITAEIFQTKQMDDEAIANNGLKVFIAGSISLMVDSPDAVYEAFVQGNNVVIPNGGNLMVSRWQKFGLQFRSHGDIDRVHRM